MNYLKQILLGTSLVVLANCASSSGTVYTYNGEKYVIVSTSAVSAGNNDSDTRVIVRKSSCNWVSANVAAEIIREYGTYIRRLDSTKIKSFDGECTVPPDGSVPEDPPRVVQITTVELEGVPPEGDEQQGD